MNTLIDPFPNAVIVDGKEYELNTDFRTGLRIIMAFEDEELSAAEKQAVMLTNLYKTLPDNLEEAARMAIKFLDKGKARDGDGEPGLRLFSYSHDADYIFAAFRQTHGVDLETAEMHWWKFVTLFMDIGKDTTFSSLIGLRKRVKTGKASKDEKEMATELGDIFKVPDIENRTIEELEAERLFEQKLEKGKRLRNGS